MAPRASTGWRASAPPTTRPAGSAPRRTRRGGGSGFSESGSGFGGNGFGAGRQRGPLLIEGELTAKSSGTSAFDTGARVFHVKFGPGSVASVDGNKLTVDFDKAGRKMVLDSFVQKAG